MVKTLVKGSWSRKSRLYIPIRNRDTLPFHIVSREDAVPYEIHNPSLSEYLACINLNLPPSNKRSPMKRYSQPQLFTHAAYMYVGGC